MKPAPVDQALHPSQPISHQRLPSPLKRLYDLLKVYFERWSRRYRLRYSLYEMDTRLIEKDIGLPAGSLAEEAHKPFWRD